MPLDDSPEHNREPSLNVLGQRLESCSRAPLTGFFRDGCCETGLHDAGRHVICAEVTADFLSFSKSRGNDLTTPREEYRFAGLKPGDRWCLCAERWREALLAGMAPRVVLRSTHMAALRTVTLDDLKRHALDLV
jgi:uncharacterized protein (DUF2237 family)